MRLQNVYPLLKKMAGQTAGARGLSGKEMVQTIKKTSHYVCKAGFSDKG